jgi:protein-disulfide isomerase
MLKHRSVTLLLGLSALCSSPSPLTAQEPPAPRNWDTAASLQKQIDDLKEGQRRILQELEQIKKLLQDRPARADFAAKPNVISLNVHGEPFRGAGGARVAIMEYSDFDCSFCARYAREIFPRIDADYIKTGKVKYFFRDLPEPGETNAVFKARAARCAGEQGKFWEMHELLFADTAVRGEEALVAYAQGLGIDLDGFKHCLASDRYAEAISRSAASAERLGIKGTPGFLIGTATEDGDFVRMTRVFVGAESYGSFKSILDELLAAQPQK